MYQIYEWFFQILSAYFLSSIKTHKHFAQVNQFTMNMYIILTISSIIINIQMWFELKWKYITEEMIKDSFIHSCFPDHSHRWPALPGVSYDFLSKFCKIYWIPPLLLDIWANCIHSILENWKFFPSTIFLNFAKNYSTILWFLHTL
jgi:hypothetical protein